MFARLLLLFIAIPVLELCIFMVLGSKIGIPTTLAIIILTAILGAWLTKSQGLKALSKYQSALSQGRLPHEEVMDGLLILVAGAVLLTPGFLTDAIGFTLLVPSLRDIAKTVVKGYLSGKISVAGETMGAPKPAPGSSRVINIEAEVVEDAPRTKGENHQST
ncbi:MAG: FxsA family protein [Verrucomicrobiales bacterium]|nr:FxsA family protein [Verrucomicrobiales bacterium]